MSIYCAKSANSNDPRQGTHRFIKEMGFKRMTPVQAIAVPLVLNQRDVAVEAEGLRGSIQQQFTADMTTPGSSS